MLFEYWFPEGLWAIDILGGIDSDLRETVSHICNQLQKVAIPI